MRSEADSSATVPRDARRAVQLALTRAVALPLGFALAIALALIFGIQNLMAVSRSVDHADEVIAAANHHLRLLIDAETGLRGYLLTGDPDLLEPHQMARVEIPRELANLGMLVALDEDDASAARVVRDLRVSWERWEAASLPRIASRNATAPEQMLREVREGKRQMDTMRAQCAQFVRTESTRRAEREAGAHRATRLVISSVLVLLVLMGAAFVIVTRREVRAVVERYQHALEESRLRAEALAESEARARASARSADEARAEAERANHLKDEFLATLSHELRTPLTAILGWARLLATAASDEARLTRGLATIERNARHQAQLVEDLLDVSSISAGVLPLELLPTDLAVVARAAVESAQIPAHAAGIELVTDLGTAPCMVSGDARRLQQAVGNLLSNAVKFTPRGGTVHVALGREGMRAVLRVSDTGRGIDPAFLPHVFERFRQGEASRTRAHGGLGIGLSIVRQVVEMHGGTVSVTSAGEGCGATSTLSLPLQTDADAAPA